MARGSIVQRSPGTWYLRVPLEPDPATGKRRQKAETFRGTKAAAEKRLRELLSAAEQGLVGTSGTMTLTAFLARYLDAHVKPNRTPKTHANYAHLVAHQIVPVIGRVRLDKLRQSHALALLDALRTMPAMRGRKGKPAVPTGRTLSPVRQRQAFVLLRTALGQAMRWKLIATNPTDGVDSPTVVRVEMHPWTAPQAGAFLAASSARGLFWRAFFAVALNTGMRLAELVGLRWDDVDLDASTVSVAQTIAHVTGVGWVVKPPKTKAGLRTVPIGPELVALLRQHKAEQNGDRLRLGGAWDDWGLVFPSSVGTPLHSYRPRAVLDRTAAAAGVPLIRIHDLRHTAATLMLAVNREPAKVVSERLGHASVLVTLGIYGHLLPGLQERAAVALEDLLRDAAAGA